MLGLPYLWNTTAYAAVTSIAVIGLYIAYVLPTFLRLRRGESFQRGPWHLGRWSRPIGTVAVIWVCVITVLFMLPQVSPVTTKTFNYTPIAVVWVCVITVLFMLPQVSPVTTKSFNYTPVAVAVVLGFAGIWWLLSPRKWFTGPKVQGTAEELAAIEQELETF